MKLKWWKMQQEIWEKEEGAALEKVGVQEYKEEILCRVICCTIKTCKFQKMMLDCNALICGKESQGHVLLSVYEEYLCLHWIPPLIPQVLNPLYHCD